MDKYSGNQLQNRQECHWTLVVHYLLSMLFIFFWISTVFLLLSFDLNETPGHHLTFSQWKMHFWNTHICCISFIQFGNHVPFTFLIGRALVSAPFISILINKVLLNWIRRCLIETEIMITAKAALCSVFVFFLALLFSHSRNETKPKKWFP